MACAAGMGGALGDLRLAGRTFLRSPGMSSAAVLAMALGMGGSAAIFSVVDAVVLRPLLPANPEQLVRLYVKPAALDAHYPFSPLDYFDLQKESSSFAALAALRPVRLSLATEAGPEQIDAAQVTASFFAALGVQPALGRAPSNEDDMKGTAPVAVITDALWRRAFNADPRVLGRTVTLDGRASTVIGVLPRGFRFPLLRLAEALVPFGFEGDDLVRRDHMYLSVIGRLRSGTSLAQAQADLDVVGPRIEARQLEHSGRTQRALPLLDDLVGPIKPALQALLGAVLLVLLIACADVAGMLLAHGMARHREIAIRAALGSGRGRIIRQLLSESLLLALAGGALGTLLASWSVDALLLLAPRSIPRLDEVRVDAKVLLFALALSVASGLLAGLLPALQTTRPDLMEALKSGGGAPSRGRARSALVVAQIALALVLAAGAGLMIRTLSRLLDVSTGLGDASHVLVADVDLPQQRYGKDAQVIGFAQRLRERASALPGVKSVALMSNVPLDPRYQATLGFVLDGAPPPSRGQTPKVETVFASEGYLETLGVPLLRGRTFLATDT